MSDLVSIYFASPHEAALQCTYESLGSTRIRHECHPDFRDDAKIGLRKDATFRV